MNHFMETLKLYNYNLYLKKNNNTTQSFGISYFSNSKQQTSNNKKLTRVNLSKL